MKGIAAIFYRLRNLVSFEKILLKVVSVMVVLTGWMIYPDDAQAVPSFARKYDISCNVCHTRQPRLNPYGQRFQENGYQLPGTEDGGTAAKSLFGGPLYGVTIDENISNYFAVRLRADVQKADFKEKTEATDDVDIVLPNIINLFFAGAATQNISFLLEGEYATQEAHEAALAFERAMLIFSNIGGHQLINAKIGVFDPSSFYSFPTHRQQLNPIPPEAHTGDFPPEINRVPLLPMAFSSKMFGLTTGESNEGEDGFAILPFEPYLFNAPFQTGLTLYGRPIGSEFFYQIGAVQNETAKAEPETRWDYYAMLRYDVIQTDYSAVQVSGFYYNAPEAAMPTLNMSGTLVFADDVVDWIRYGVAARWHNKIMDIYGTIIWDKIDTPKFTGMMGGTSKWDTKAVGASIEADWLVSQKWMLGVRYDMMEPGGLVKGMPSWDAKLNQDVSFLGVIAKYYTAPNVALYCRAHFNLKNSSTLPSASPFDGKEHPARNLRSMFTVGVDMSF